MIKKVLIAVVVLIAGLFTYAALQPSQYTIQRQITINAPAEKIFPYLNNNRLAEQWGPWKDLDPDTVMTQTGPEAGVGAKTSWQGGKKMGTGSATIVESTANSQVRLKLEYTEPMSMVQDAQYLLKSSGAQSTVTWMVSGENNIFSRIMCLFVDMDKMVGSMFEKGLAKLKTISEQA